MSQIELIQNSIILGEQDYILAIDSVIAEAQDELLIFDQDFSIGAFASIRRFDLIHNYLNKSPASKLSIILQDSTYFTTQCPRLFGLLTTFGHKLKVYETNSHAKIAKDCFVLADKKNYVRRFHVDQARFKFSLDDVETTASLNNRFDELLQETSHTISSVKLGL